MLPLSSLVSRLNYPSGATVTWALVNAVDGSIVPPATTTYFRETRTPIQIASPVTSFSSRSPLDAVIPDEQLRTEPLWAAVIGPTDGSKKKGELQSPVEGRYQVQRRSDRTFTSDRKSATEIMNSARVTKAPRPHNAHTFAPEPGQLSKVTNGPQYTVQKILKHRVAAEDDLFNFLMKWTDYEEPS